jgi:hypothetical protein
VPHLRRAFTGFSLLFSCTSLVFISVALNGLAISANAQETEPASPVAPTPPSDALATTLPTIEELESQGAVIGTITIVNGNVFDTSDPREDRALFRLANSLRSRTRQEVIRRQLLFSPGNKVSARLIKESERILRSDRYIYDAKIVPVRYQDDRVDMEVRTRDVWTLKPGISVGRSGGTNSTRFELEESNLFGLGKEITFSHRSNVDRDETMVRYTDPQVFGTWVGLVAGYSSNSDGKERELSITRPFYALDSTWAAGGGALDWDRVDSLYNFGHVVQKFRHQEQNFQLFGGGSNGVVRGWVQRLTYGMAYESDSFSTVADPLSPPVLPTDRKLVYPFVGYDWIQDHFEERRNQSQMGRTEDFFAGAFLRTFLGFASTQFGSDRDSLLIGLQGGNSLENLDASKTLLISTQGATRIEHGGLRNATLQTDARFYWRATERQLFFGGLTGVITKNLDAEQQLVLGGSNEPALKNNVLQGPGLRGALASPDLISLRGYPLRYQDGSSMAQLTLEHRYYTSWYLFRILYVGGAAFMDVGRTWGRGTTGAASAGILKDVGFGLRLANSRSSFGRVIHVDLAFPLGAPAGIDKVQFIVETKSSF